MANGKYHAKQGLYFVRRDDGSVLVQHYLTGTANGGRADQAFVDVLNREWDLTASEWASVVAAVSSSGESSETYDSALAFHVGSDS